MLNLAWVCLGFAALGITIHASLRTNERFGRRRWLLVVGVALIVAALFPYISASDDMLRIARLEAHHDKSGGTTKHGKTDDLMRLYEAMDTPLVCRIASITFTLFLIGFIFFIPEAGIDRNSPRKAGRSPPLPVSVF
jgi:hypothetical protein